jgi:hypothetical protein
MRGVFIAARLGRHAVRAGGSGQRQAGPPPRFGIFGTTVCLILFAAIFAHWWRECLIGLVVMVVFVFPVSYAAGKSSLDRQARARRCERDALDDLMARWDEEGRR